MPKNEIRCPIQGVILSTLFLSHMESWNHWRCARRKTTWRTGREVPSKQQDGKIIESPWCEWTNDKTCHYFEYKIEEISWTGLFWTCTQFKILRQCESGCVKDQEFENTECWYRNELSSYWHHAGKAVNSINSFCPAIDLCNSCPSLLQHGS